MKSTSKKSKAHGMANKDFNEEETKFFFMVFGGVIVVYLVLEAIGWFGPW